MVSPNQMRSLGKTGLQVSPIGLGVMEMAGGGGLAGMIFPVMPQEDKNSIIKAALDGGINFFDTAEMYGMGVSERSLADGLKAAGKADSDVVIETKWMPFLRTAGNIKTSITDRLRFLGGYSISNFMVHQPWSFSSPEAEMNAMADLVEAGKVRSVGVSNFNPERMRRAHAALAARGLPLALNQVRLSLLHREIEADGTLATARELGVTIVAYTPLGRGVLSGKYLKDPALLEHLPGIRRRMMRRDVERSRPLLKVLDEIAQAHGVTIAQVALNWVILFNGDLVVTIPGATKVSQAQEAAGAMSFALSEEELHRLDEASKQSGR